MIHDHLPGDVRSHANVEKWLVENWKNINKLAGGYYSNRL